MLFKIKMERVVFIISLLQVQFAYGQNGGYGLNFDGSNDYVFANINMTITKKTFSAWVKLANTSQYGGGLVSLQTTGGAVFDAIVYNETLNGWGFGSNNFTRTTWSGVSENSTNWIHIAATYDHNDYKLYRNGIQIHTSNAHSANTFTSNLQILLGQRHTGGSNAFLNAIIDNAQVWSKELTQSEIQEYMHKDLTGSESNLVAYYKMSNGTGTSLTDNSTNSNTGTLTNMVTSGGSSDWVTSYAPIGDLGSSYETDVEGLWSMSGTSESDASTGLTLTVGSALSTGNFAVFGNNNTSGSSGSDIGSVASTERSGRIWQMDESGTVSATVKIDISDATGLSPSMGTASNYLLLYRSGTSGNFSSAASGASTSGDVVTFSSVSLQDGYYALGTHSDASLPVEISSFALLDVRDESMTLQWVTESELNNLGFILERRSALTDWLQIASYLTDSSLEGQGTVSHRTTYVYEDEGVEMDQVYDYRLADVDVHGNVEYHSLQLMGVSSSNMPEQFILYPNYPNPFNPVTTIRYDLPEDSFVDVTIYDMLGNVVSNLVKTNQSSGYKSIQWNATNNHGEPVSAGVYLYKIQAGDLVDTKKMILLK